MYNNSVCPLVNYLRHGLWRRNRKLLLRKIKVNFLFKQNHTKVLDLNVLFSKSSISPATVIHIKGDIENFCCDSFLFKGMFKL